MPSEDTALPTPAVSLTEMVPVKAKARGTTWLNISISHELFEDVDALAKELVMSRSHVVRHLLLYALRQLGRPSRTDTLGQD